MQVTPLRTCTKERFVYKHAKLDFERLQAHTRTYTCP